MRVVAITAICGVAVLGIGGCGGDIQPDELSRSIDTLISSAGEGRLIAEGVADDRTKTTFVRVRARELGEIVDHEGEKLDDASAAPDLAAEKQAAVSLADEISSALGQLQLDPADEATADATERTLSRLASRAKRLQGSL